MFNVNKIVPEQGAFLQEGEVLFLLNILNKRAKLQVMKNYQRKRQDMPGSR
jgi:hypothetical protein